MPTVFTKMLTGEIADAPFIYRDDERQVAAILSHQYVNPGHATVFSYRPAETVLDLNPNELQQLNAVTHALGRLMRGVYNPRAIIEHTEGAQVPHAHRVLFPVYERGESDKLHHHDQLTPATPEYYESVLAQLVLTDDMVEAEIPKSPWIYVPRMLS